MNELDHASVDPSSVSKIESPRVPLMSFATKVPVSMLDSIDEITTRESPFGQRSVVGTITLLQNCVIVWVGWGESEEILHDHDISNLDLQSALGQSPTVSSQQNNRNLPTNTKTRVSLGKGKPPQGQCTVAMPRTIAYKGAFATGAKDLPCSQIIGGGSTDAQVLASQMASRLSAKLSMAIFVSCQLANGISAQSDQSSSVPPLAAAAAEKEIIKVIQSELAVQIC
ncbi:unnamed protein product [Cylindrotheca closterium]|uniref:Uncharacterized protein n=1 Tax=Cylindrotheca closterium TaxID=2856 RepID=A0AAD2FN56_9STRA|nr:unnamed protein product [Cylindrotheca closterium]